MVLYFANYFSLFVHFLISIVFAFVFFGLSYIVATQKGDIEKLSAYECGFDPFDDARNTFDVRFYLVAILFIIFDLEISFFFPLVSFNLQATVVWVLVHDIIFANFDCGICL